MEDVFSAAGLPPLRGGLKAPLYVPYFDALVSHPSFRDGAAARIAEIAGCSPEALMRARQRAHPGGEASLRYLMSPETEKAVFGVCMSMASYNQPLDVSRLTVVIEKITNNRPSTSTVRNFLHRHSALLGYREGSVLAAKRSGPEILEQTLAFCDQWGGTTDTHNIKAFNMAFTDEFRAGFDGKGRLVIVPVGAAHQNIEQPRGDAYCTYMLVTFADGTTPFRVYIFKRQPGIDDVLKVFAPAKRDRLRGAPVRLFLQSDTGYLTGELWDLIIMEFHAWWETIHPGLEVFLLCDQLAIHRDVDVILRELKALLHIWTIMSNCSHWFQLHDQHPFAALRRSLNAQLKHIDWTRDMSPQDRRQIVADAFYQAEDIALDPSVVTKALAAIHIMPFNPHKIIEIAKERSHAVPPKHDDPLVQGVIKGVDEFLKTQREFKAAAAARVEVKEVPASGNFVFSPQARAAAVQMAAAAAQKVEETKAAKAKAKEAREEDVREAKRRKAEERLASTCQNAGCTKYYKSSPAWVKCERCNAHFCPKHKRDMDSHACRKSKKASTA